MPAIALMLIVSVVYLWSQKTGFHDFSGKCDDCHLTTPKKGKAPIFRNDISFLCNQCHQEIIDISHPVGMKPSMAVPSVYPLDWKGNLTCISCHIVHEDNIKSGKFLLRTPLLGEVFCRECHVITDNEGVDIHKSTIDMAHLGKRYVENTQGDVIDELSIRCLNCHDAVFAQDSLVSNVKSGAYTHKENIGLTHPIGVDYVALASWSGAYTPYVSLDKRIKLFNNKVGCGSCHNPYSTRHFQLVMSNEHSALCYACHRK